MTTYEIKLFVDWKNYPNFYIERKWISQTYSFIVEEFKWLWSKYEIRKETISYNNILDLINEEEEKKFNEEIIKNEFIQWVLFSRIQKRNWWDDLLINLKSKEEVNELFKEYVLKRYNSEHKIVETDEEWIEIDDLEEDIIEEQYDDWTLNHKWFDQEDLKLYITIMNWNFEEDWYTEEDLKWHSIEDWKNLKFEKHEVNKKALNYIFDTFKYNDNEEYFKELKVSWFITDKVIDILDEDIQEVIRKLQIKNWKSKNEFDVNNFRTYDYHDVNTSLAIKLWILRECIPNWEVERRLKWYSENEWKKVSFEVHQLDSKILDQFFIDYFKDNYEDLLIDIEVNWFFDPRVLRKISKDLRDKLLERYTQWKLYWENASLFKDIYTIYWDDYSFSDITWKVLNMFETSKNHIIYWDENYVFNERFWEEEKVEFTDDENVTFKSDLDFSDNSEKTYRILKSSIQNLIKTKWNDYDLNLSKENIEQIKKLIRDKNEFILPYLTALLANSSWSNKKEKEIYLDYLIEWENIKLFLEADKQFFDIHADYVYKNWERIIMSAIKAIELKNDSNSSKEVIDTIKFMLDKFYVLASEKENKDMKSLEVFLSKTTNFSNEISNLDKEINEIVWKIMSEYKPKWLFDNIKDIIWKYTWLTDRYTISDEQKKLIKEETINIRSKLDKFVELFKEQEKNVKTYTHKLKLTSDTYKWLFELSEKCSWYLELSWKQFNQKQDLIDSLNVYEWRYREVKERLDINIETYKKSIESQYENLIKQIDSKKEYLKKLNSVDRIDKIEKIWN